MHIIALETYREKYHKRKKDVPFVFLAGPIMGAPKWREEIINGNYDMNICWVNPDRGIIPKEMFKLDEQSNWETMYIRMSDVMLIWIPKPIENIPGRDYAQTTRIEFGENIARKKKIIMGIEPGVHGEQYIRYKAERYGIMVYNTLKDTLNATIAYLKSKQEKDQQPFFTSDTHFGSQRALELSKRPFVNTVDMDWTMVERWNNVVPIDANVFHLGDFGNYEMVKYLNGHIHLLLGNYERKEFDNSIVETKEQWMKIFLHKYPFEAVKDDISGLTSIAEPDLNNDNKFLTLYMVHEPSYAINGYFSGDKGYYGLNVLKKLDKDSKENQMLLFGHIHGRQKIKHVGMDVGVDGNNFTPVDLSTICFYHNAINKFYDENVFIDYFVKE